MKILIAILLFSLQVNANTYYVATNGNDANPGTFASPFLTWDYADAIMVAGDSLIIRGGRYPGRMAGTDVQVRWQNLNGNSTDSIVIINYPGESPILDLSDTLYTNADVYGIYLEYSDHVKIKGLRVTGLAQNPSGNVVYGFVVATDADNNVIEQVEVDSIGGTCFLIYYADNNLILNCDSHHYGDPYSVGYEWGGSNGFAVTANTATGTTFRGCRAWRGSDNGFAFFNGAGIITIDQCWAFGIGWQNGTTTPGGDGVGFKLGPNSSDDISYFRITATRCLAFENRYMGFDENRNSASSYKSKLFNNTSWQNGTNNTVGSYTYADGYNYAFYDNTATEPPHQLTNNISFTGSTLFLGSANVFTTNSWQGGLTVTSDDFISLSSTGMNGARQADGSLPDLNFLHLTSTSDLRNAGTQVGYGLDLGCFQYPSAGLPNFIQRGRRVIN